METVNLNEKSGLLQAIRYFSDPLTCLETVSKAKWPNGPECPRCGGKRLSFLKTRLMWTCLECRKQFSVKVGTIFEDSAIGLDKWLVAMWMLANCKNGVSSYEIGRALKVTQKTAWFMLHRIRYAQHEGTINKMSGEIEADETYIGGKLRNMHAEKQARLRGGKKRTGGFEGKAIVMGLLERHTGKARVKVLPNTRSYNVRRNVIDNVEKGSTVYTDSLRSYRNLPVDGFAHDFIDHTESYVRERVHTNGLENLLESTETCAPRNLRIGRTVPPASLRRRASFPL